MIKKRISGERRWYKKGIRYFKRSEYEIVEKLSSKYTVSFLFQVMDINPSEYFKWLNRKDDKTDTSLNVYVDMGLQSVIRRKRKNYIPSIPKVTADNILNREFKAEMPNQKWLTDITEFKYGNDKKAYLSAIFDLGDNSIVSYVLGHSNNNELVFRTFNMAVKENPGAKPLFHSDRGFQYTSLAFRKMLDDTGCTQSMSRVGRCLDNAPMEGFWGNVKCIISINLTPIKNWKKELKNMCTSTTIKGANLNTKAWLHYKRETRLWQHNIKFFVFHCLLDREQFIPLNRALYTYTKTEMTPTIFV